MYVGVMVFGTLLSEVQNTIEDLYHLRYDLRLAVAGSLSHLLHAWTPKYCVGYRGSLEHTPNSPSCAHKAGVDRDCS
jgi:hypothetical protein